MDPTLLIVLGVVALAAILGILVAVRRPSAGAGPGRRTQAPVRERRGEIALTDHARQRMAQRRVQRAHLELVVRSPEREARDDRQGSIRLERDFGDSTLKVWVLPTQGPADRVVVKTTAWSVARTIRVPRGEVGALIGRGGSHVRALEQRTGARISVGRDGAVTVTADSPELVDAAVEQVRAATGR
ncbi:KH domain-containing protein [Agrococcus sp. SL85]|uniref:KH domain-containing protein n=1 Tax=Agrococcus sp. SL85 TaxID=2995141 RepID=UPI00226C84C8|nr:KH domain-containing protein [Agrococcus sp. SL85]WAC66743.1 KH domain-containing protein [Agrococcus sp. SL85]